MVMTQPDRPQGPDAPSSNLGVDSPDTGTSRIGSGHHASSFPIFEAWKEYEKVAVHFNELIIRLRSQSLGGVAALATLAGVVLHDTGQGAPRWRIMAAAFLLLCLIWVAIWVLDFRYYNRLLIGAVNALLDLEAKSKDSAQAVGLTLSTEIENAVKKRAPRAGSSGRWLFYSLVMIALLAGLGFSLVAAWRSTS